MRDLPQRVIVQKEDKIYKIKKKKETNLMDTNIFGA